MTSKSPGVLSLVLIPALVSLVVTVLRLVGELNGWNATLFGNAAPGTKTAQGLFGISLLIPIFGFWFGLRLRTLTDQPASVGRSALILLIGVGVMIGGMWALAKADLVAFPKEEQPVVAKGFGYMLGLMAVSAGVAVAAWPRLGLTLLVYAVLARIPVIVITWLAVDGAWDTHYAKPAPGLLPPEGVGTFAFLAMPQYTFWIVVTMLFGGLFGCFGAMCKRSKN